MKQPSLQKEQVNQLKTVSCHRQSPGAYHRVEHLKGATLGQAPALPANIRLGWKGLPGTNTLAYDKNP